MNSFHDTIKFTFSWLSEKVDCLDFTVVLNDGIVSTDVFGKPTDKQSINFIPRATPSPVRRVSLLGRPSGCAVFVPRMLPLRNGLTS